MANGLKPLAGLCALYFICVGCGSEGSPGASSTAGAPATGGGGSASTSGGGGVGASGVAGSSNQSGASPSGGTSPNGGTSATGSGGKPSAGGGGDPPDAVDGQSVYALECHGESKDCNQAAVPCFGVGSSKPNVAAGWACANRCNTSADCSDAPSGAEAQASCVSFTSAGHCVLVCKNESQSFSCPTGMTCYTPPKSPIGYCLWP